MIELRTEIDLYKHDASERIFDYQEGYIADIFSDMTDSATFIYDGDLWDWAKENECEVLDVIADGDWQGYSFTLPDIFMTAQFHQIESELYYDWSDVMYTRALYYLIEQGEKNIALDTSIELRALADRYDEGCYLEDFLEEVLDITNIDCEESDSNE